MATAIQGYLIHPDVNRTEAVEAIRFISEPMRRMQITRLRAAFRDFQRVGTIRTLLDAIAEIRAQFGETAATPPLSDQRPYPVLTRDDLRLVCFDFING